jgi:PAS domain S-box-containing protein
MPDVFEGIDLWLVDSLVVPASLHDLEGRFVYMNAAAERASGRSNAQLLGHDITYLLPVEVHEHVREQFRRAVERGEPTDFETVFIDTSGQLRGVRAQQLPLQVGDAVIGVLILAFDVHHLTSGPIGLQRWPQLTPRQREVLNLMASGLSTTEMARELTLSAETVRNHLRNLFRELHAHTRPEAIASARRLGLLAEPLLAPQELEPGCKN